MTAKRRAAKVRSLRARDGDDCWLCHQPINFDLPLFMHEASSLDHVVPQSQGGTYCLDNLKLAHRSCNNARHAQPAMEAA